MLNITRSEYDKKAQTLKARQYEIDDLCRDKTEADDDFKTTISTLLDISQRAFDLFKNSEAEQQHRLLKILLPKNIITDGKLHLQAKKPFQQFLGFAQKTKWLHTLDAIRNDWFNGGRGEMSVMAMVSRGMFGLV